MAGISALRPPSLRIGTLKQRFRRYAHEHAASVHGEPLQETDHSTITPSKHTPRPFQAIKGSVTAGGALRPFRLLRQDLRNLKIRYYSDWATFNQLIFASAVYMFFTNILPGLTFASDLYTLTGQNWGTIEVIFSTGICGVIFSLSVYLYNYICLNLIVIIFK